MESRASKRVSVLKKRCEPSECSNSIQVITISDSSDSEIEPTNKKRKARPLPPSPKKVDQTPMYNAVTKIKLEKGLDNPSTTGTSTEKGLTCTFQFV